MSADRWSVCPQCQKTHDAKINKGLALLDAGYGNLSREDYKALEASVSELQNRQLPETLRQDYEIGIFDDTDYPGFFSVDFGAGCSVCDFTYFYNYTTDEELV